MCLRYCFSLYSSQLKRHFGYSQEQIQGIGSANNLGEQPLMCVHRKSIESHTAQSQCCTECFCKRLLHASQRHRQCRAGAHDCSLRN